MRNVKKIKCQHNLTTQVQEVSNQCKLCDTTPDRFFRGRHLHSPLSTTPTLSDLSSDIRLAFDDGTLVLLDAPPEYEPPSPFVWDSRVGRWRAQAHRYRQIVEALRAQEVGIKNVVPRYNRLKLTLKREHAPHPHQTEALDAWRSNERRGVVVLPTGSGKSLLALMGIAEVNRSTMVVAPTIDLMNQWYDLLKDAFSCAVGILGGGYHELEDLTVTTYDSAYMNMGSLRQPVWLSRL